MAYHPRNPKIDLYVRRHPADPWKYACSTNWSRTCREAVANYQPDNGAFQVKARIAKG